MEILLEKEASYYIFPNTEVLMQYWLMKSEPDAFSIDDLKRDTVTKWEGVRNFQARNFMRDRMKLGDLALFYHSNAHPSGVIGICRVCSHPIPDETAQNPQSQYFDPKASPEHPIWMMVKVEFVKKFKEVIPLAQLRETKGLEDMVLLRKGSRLSITPVTKKEYDIINKLALT
jgi:predicted RNA-binding protein with PUA-like domain